MYYRCGSGGGTGGDAIPENVLSGKTFTNDSGAQTGTMTNRGAVTATLDKDTTSYTVPSGYHNGSGTVSITTQTKNADPSTAAQTIEPDSGKLLSSVGITAVSAKKTLAQTDTGSNVDMAGAYRYVDASAVYNKGKSDGMSDIYAVVGVSTQTFNGQNVTVSKDGTVLTTATFDSTTGYCSIGIPESGTYTFTVTY